MCCVGCQAVAMAIIDGGLESFYRYRAEATVSTLTHQRDAGSTSAIDWKIYNLPEVQSEFVTAYDTEHYQANLLLEGISCAACSWLIEAHLKKNSAIKIVSVNISTHRCTIVWAYTQMQLSELLQALTEIGYRPRPATDEQQQALIKQQDRIALFRLGVAGFGMMQTMIVAVGIYTGAVDVWLDFLRWLSLLVATPVVFFSAAPFFKAAWRSIQSRQLIMDVPVALAIGLAYLASAWATIHGGGEVYFESVSMFTFFLLLGRYVEQRARHRNRLAFANLAQLMPLTACCITQQDGQEIICNVPLKKLALGDLVLVKAGDTFPCDGVVIDGESEVVEALITGEALPLFKKSGDSVIAGTLNKCSVLRIKVTAIGGATQLSGIERLTIQAAEEKPRQVVMADKVARFFVGRLLVVCIGVFIFWWFKDSSRALWITLSVLVVTCPCALALAMPAALSAATANLRQRGFLVARGHVIEMLPKITRVIFDKTGTLTKGDFCVNDVKLCNKPNAKINFQRDQVLAIGAALEADSSHPIAKAFKIYKNEMAADNARQIPGAGVEGYIDNKIYRLGAPAFAREIIAQSDDVVAFASPRCGLPVCEFPAGELPGHEAQAPDEKLLWLLLCDNQGAIAWFSLQDELRPNAHQAVAELQAMGIAVELLSGDQSAAVAATAQQLNIKEYIAGATPADKLARLNITQLGGDRVLMVGDGINDVPVLAGADVSVAMAAASDLAQTSADTVLLNDQLVLLPQAIRIAERANSIIKQNLFFSLTYNIIALPLAATGNIAPWAAAIGMTMSSLIVVMNALRLSKLR